MIRCTILCFAVALGASQSTAETPASRNAPDVANEILNNALEESLALLLSTPGDIPEAELDLSLSANDGIWSLNGAMLQSNAIVVPVGVTIAIRVTAVDTIYDMKFPELELEFAAIPGRIETIYIKFFQTGQYSGDCLQCGPAGAPLTFVVRDDPL